MPRRLHRLDVYIPRESISDAAMLELVDILEATLRKMLSAIGRAPADIYEDGSIRQAALASSIPTSISGNIAATTHLAIGPLGGYAFFPHITANADGIYLECHNTGASNADAPYIQLYNTNGTQQAYDVEWRRIDT